LTSSLVRYWRRCSDDIHPDDEPFFRSLAHSFNLEYPPPAYIGDVEKAPVVILFANGGYDKEKTPAEFATTQKTRDFIWRLHHPGPVESRDVIEYWAPYEALLTSGQACAVNACAYRSKSISDETQNQRMCDLLPSVHVHRKWLITELIPQARNGKRLVIAHRWALWRISPKEDFGEYVRFSRTGRGRYLSKELRSLAESWKP
jgi:hypothetical protein